MFQLGSCYFLFLTESCNLSCEHCYVSASPAKGLHMSRDVFAKSIDLMKSQGVKDVRLTGGEPTIHPDFEVLVSELYNLGFKTRLISNGVRLIRNPTLWANVRQSITKTWISIYGITDEQHRKVGGRAALPASLMFKFVSDNQSEGADIGLSAVLNPGEGKHISDFLYRLMEHSILRVRIIPWQPDGRAIVSTDSFSAGEFVREVKSTYQALLDFPYRKSFKHLSINNPFNLDLDPKLGKDSCLLHNRQMWSITPDGSIYSCCFNAFDNNHRVGDVRQIGMVGESIAKMRPETYSKKCRGVRDGFWNDRNACSTTCPISSVTVSK